MSELTAIVQYMTQSEMCQNWGYKRLGQRTKARTIEEMKHAEGLIERIIFLDATPTVRAGWFLTALKNCYSSITLPSLIVVTCGRCAGLATQKQCLEMLGCNGKGEVKEFARSMLLSCWQRRDISGRGRAKWDRVTAHERMGRNRSESKTESRHAETS